VSLPRAPRAVIFDMDGLLIDSESIYRDAMLEVAAEGQYELPWSVISQMVGLPWANAVHALTAHYGPAFDVAAFRDEAVRRFHLVADTGICLKAGVVELLDHLDTLALPRAICTGSGPHEVQKHMGEHGLLGRFDTIVARGDYVRGKPEPEPFLLAAERLSIDPADCLALEDSYNGVRAASAAGMMTVMVPDLLHASDEMLGLCARIADSLHDVRDLLKG
jgi:beta-phosphoglucomutase-like phosphatase (HAD superfamily)